MTITSSRSRQGSLPLAAILVTAALGLSACSNDAGTAGAPESFPVETGPVELTLATPSTQGGVENYYTPLIQAFTKENPNVTIKIEETPADQHGPVLRTRLQGGNAPDIFQTAAGRGNPNSFADLAEAGYLQDLSGQDWATGSVPTTAKELYFQDEKLFALPVDLSAFVMVQNEGVRESLGLKNPATLDDVIAQCETVKAAGKSLFALGGSSVPNTSVHAMEVAASVVYAKDPDWEQKRKNKEVTFAESDWKKVLERIVEFNKAGCYQEGAVGTGIQALFPAVAQGKSTAVFAPAGAIAALRAQVKDGKFDLGVLPGESSGDSRLILSPTNALALNAESAHKGTALKFLEFLAQRENQDALAKANGNLSITSALSGEAPDAYPALDPYFADGASKTIVQPNLLWPNNAVNEALGTGVQGLLTGQATPEQVLKSMDAAYDRGA